MSNVTLLINGQHHHGWKEVMISRSMERAASSFDLTYTDRWADQSEARTISLGDACEVWIDDSKIITGYIDEATPEYDSKNRTLKVSGRSKVADLVDCTLPAADLNGVQFNNQTFPQLATAVAAKFGVKVVTNTKGFKPIRTAVIEQAQPVFEFLEERARAEAVLLNDDANGKLVITRAGTTRITTPLVLGENILSAKGQFSHRDRFSQYVIAAQQGGWDDNSGAESAHIRGKATDKGISRYRPTVIQAEEQLTKADAPRRAQWQRNVKYGRSRAITYTVNGWYHKEGLWQPNTLVNVRDAWMGIADEWLMIAEVKYTLNEGGELAEITVMPPEAFDLVPMPLQETGSW